MIEPTNLSDTQLDYLRKTIYLEQRSKFVEVLLQEGLIESNNGIAGFWRGEEWVSIYEVLEKTNGDI